jgi:hypothetical protein
MNKLGRPQKHSNETQQLCRDLAAVLGTTAVSQLLNIPLPTVYRFCSGCETATPTEIAQFFKFVHGDDIKQLTQMVRDYQTQ